MITWTDTSSRKNQGTTFQAKAGPFLLTVTRHIHYLPDEWVCSVQGLIPQRVLARGISPLAAMAAITDQLQRELLGALTALGEGRQV